MTFTRPIHYDCKRKRWSFMSDYGTVSRNHDFRSVHAVLRSDGMRQRQLLEYVRLARELSELGCTLHEIGAVATAGRVLEKVAKVLERNPA